MIWRYKAIAIQAPAERCEAVIRIGELAGESAAEVRAALRRIGLQVIELKPQKRTQASFGSGRQRGLSWALLQSMRESLHGHLRRRRVPARAEVYDSLATMLQSGLALLDALDTIIAATGVRRFFSQRVMLVALREQLRAGSSLSDAMKQVGGSWFDAVEIAMVGAGQHSGTLPGVLRSLAERHDRSGELNGKLVSALAYPAIVAIVGIGVTAFLSINTLPQLASILNGAGISSPQLTTYVMAIGQFFGSNWLMLGWSAVAAMGVLLVLRSLAAQQTLRLPWQLRIPTPLLLRRLAVARFAQQLAELLRSGVPMVDSLRVLAPVTGSRALRDCLREAAESVERGDELSAAMNDPHWFDAEFRQLLEVGQASGELDVLLDRVAMRYSRQTRRLIDRLTALLEPAVILILAGLVGTVVMAAVLPLLKLQEVV